MQDRQTDRGETELVVIAVLIALAVIVPYTLLRGIENFAGAFLFWTVFGVLAIAFILKILWQWRV